MDGNSELLCKIFIYELLSFLLKLGQFIMPLISGFSYFRVAFIQYIRFRDARMYDNCIPKARD